MYNNRIARTKTNYKLINKYRKNNEFYIETINKIEEIKKNYFLKNKELFYIILEIITKEDINILTKKDKRKLTKDNLKEFYLKFNDITNEEKEEIINIFFEYYFITHYIILKINNKVLEDISSYQKYLLNKILYLNYPYVFKKIADYIKTNEHLKNYIDDIKNTTLSIIISSIVKFNSDKKVKFVTYLSYWIKYGIDTEISYINKSGQNNKYNNITNLRFANSDFFDRNITNVIKNSQNKKLVKQLKLQQKNHYKKKLKILLNLNIDLLGLYNIEIENLTLTLFVNFLNSILRNKEKRDLLFNYLVKNARTIFEKNKIEINNNKTSLYKCLNFLLLDDFHYKTSHVYNINELNENSYLKSEVDFDEYDLYDKLNKVITDKEKIILEKFKLQEIDELPSELKLKFAKLIKFNKEENDEYYEMNE